MIARTRRGRPAALDASGMTPALIAVAVPVETWTGAFGGSAVGAVLDDDEHAAAKSTAIAVDDLTAPPNLLSIDSSPICEARA